MYRLVEEDNTIYEIDEDCEQKKRKAEQKNENTDNNVKEKSSAQPTEGQKKSRQ